MARSGARRADLFSSGQVSCTQIPIQSALTDAALALQTYGVYRVLLLGNTELEYEPSQHDSENDSRLPFELVH